MVAPQNAGEEGRFGDLGVDKRRGSRPAGGRFAHIGEIQEENMFGRKLLLGIAALAVIAATFAPTEASARWRGRGGFGWGGAAIGLGLGLGLAAGYPYYARAYPYGYGPRYGAYGHGYGRPYRYGCWRRVWIETPWGPRPRRAWVC
jgi:hypothetical protein